MTVEQVLNLVKEQPGSYTQILKAHHPEFYNEILNKYSGETFGEKLYRFACPASGKCEKCQAPTKFKSFPTGHSRFCSKRCSNISTLASRAEAQKKKHQESQEIYYETRTCGMCKVEFKALKSQFQQFCSVECSNIFTGQQVERLEKIKETKLENYVGLDYVNVEQATHTRRKTVTASIKTQEQFVNEPMADSSKLEILDYVKSLVGAEKVLENDRETLGGLELAIYVPHKKFALEYNGLYWHSENTGGKSRNYHVTKTNLCKAFNIRCIHIFEDEWRYKKEIVKSKIKYILNETTMERALYARNCEIREITNCREFLNTNHIQGDSPSSIKLGAFHNNELVAVMTTGKRRLALGKKSSITGEYELLRFATSKRVVGIASKLLQHFIRVYNPVKITTYADQRYSVGNLYASIGFKQIHITQPNYWYFLNGTDKRHHRFNFRKNELDKKLATFDPQLTEWENMKLNGYDRIWDCGSILYEWTKI
jgi:endogenous inhibitor of DNA gyrase (YacG/DUF329 family)